MCAPVLLHGAFLLASAGESLGGSDTQEIQEEGGEVMANPKNVSSLAELKERFADTDSIVITEYRGLTVAQITELRRSLGADVQYSVAKNTLLKLAAKEAGVEGLDDLLSGPTAIAFIKGEAVDAAKAMKKFASNNKAFVVKGGYMDGDALNADQVNAIAELDNRETTLAKLAGAMKGNLAKAAGLFNAPASQVARLGAALQEKKEA
ncbi:50S ribosomal protein L10 [Corynebacterium pseudotuberculosis]|nr:50S ribosomal protein L10 [Corynebacterium pseudotuberculosis 1/06-A]AFF21472.1 50S ribosomal protein L10 [Corynebacterium pseudotuberculosis P54B96]AJC13052.1 50S ribosomal protein L10 [Corynebacterium pseudotuberculosis]AKC73068.1 50S ribosomal protein L10 [Corynebacterium pseudotuberculosis]AKJ54982.1 50S ribosomal protein L10 [Corynebacterium pseudotuberculosis]